MNNALPVRKLLFVCSQNKLRSLTAGKLFEGFPAYDFVPPELLDELRCKPGPHIIVPGNLPPPEQRLQQNQV